MPTNDPPISPLAELLAAAKQLNQASDQVNLELQKIEKALDAANLGLTFWLEDKPIDQSDAIGGIEPHDTSEYTSDLVGFARVEGKWRLAVKRLRRVSGFYQGDMDCPFANVFVEGELTPLLKASRELRLNALRVMPDFIAALKEKVVQRVGEIEVATGNLFF